jgi:hypothetical protein
MPRASLAQSQNQYLDGPGRTVTQKTLGAEHLIACAGKKLNLPTSLSFGGTDGRTVYVGSLGLPHLVTFNSPIAGLALY